MSLLTPLRRSPHQRQQHWVPLPAASIRRGDVVQDSFGDRMTVHRVHPSQTAPGAFVLTSRDNRIMVVSGNGSIFTLR